MRLSLTVLATTTLALLVSSGTVSMDMGLALTLVIAPLLIVGGLRMAGEAPGFNPVYVCVMLVAGAVVAAGVIRLMMLLPPAGIVTLAGVLTVAALAVTLHPGRRIREHRTLGGMCEACGYDLRESEDRCPECAAPLPEELQRCRRIASMLGSPPRVGTSTPPAKPQPASSDDPSAASAAKQEPG